MVYYIYHVYMMLLKSVNALTHQADVGQCRVRQLLLATFWSVKHGE